MSIFFCKTVKQMHPDSSISQIHKECKAVQGQQCSSVRHMTDSVSSQWQAGKNRAQNTDRRSRRHSEHTLQERHVPEAKLQMSSVASPLAVHTKQQAVYGLHIMYIRYVLGAYNTRRGMLVFYQLKGKSRLPLTRQRSMKI